MTDDSVTRALAVADAGYARARLAVDEWRRVWSAAGNGVSQLGGAAEEFDAILTERLAEHRREWADYIERWEGAVGPEPPTARSIVAILRADHLPWGVSAATDPTPRRQSPG